jgi:hypothetical protein
MWVFRYSDLIVDDGCDMSKKAQQLLSPDRLYTASEIGTRPCPVPATAGVYAFYFDEPPPGIDSKDCHRINQHALLYIGIAPKAPPLNGRAASKSHLRKRLQRHYFGNAAGSTLRRTLGCLLSAQLAIQLRRVGSGSRYTFTNPGEQVLDDWMRQHAFVTWIETSAPWELETHLLSSGLRLPLNLDGNPWQEAVAIVRAIRLKARQLADQLDIIIDSGGPRKKPIPTS